MAENTKYLAIGGWVRPEDDEHRYYTPQEVADHHGIDHEQCKFTSGSKVLTDVAKAGAEGLTVLYPPKDHKPLPKGKQPAGGGKRGRTREQAHKELPPEEYVENDGPQG